MLQLLKRMLLMGTRKSVAGGRRARLTQPVGRMEQLEARTMLSASFGGAHVSPEPVEVYFGTWETGHRPELRADAHGHMSAFAEPAPHGVALGFPPVGRPPQQLLGGWQNPLPMIVVIHINSNVNTDIKTSIDIESSSGRSPELDPPPQLKAQASFPPTEAPPTNFPAGGQRPQSGPLRLTGSPQSTGLDVAATLPSLYAPSQTTTISARSTASVSLRAHDAVFQDLSSRQLLLATGASASDDDDADDDADGDPRRPSIDGPMDEIEAIADSRLRDDVTGSLDTLKREREAIEQVLAELHQLGPLAGEHDRDDARACRPAEAAEAEPVFAAEEHRLQADPSNSQSPVSSSDSGMVLLQASGDANSSVYDLTAVILNGAENSTAMPTGTEAAVGVYQAFDVGAAQPRTADANESPRGNPVAIGQSVSADRESGA